MIALDDVPELVDAVEEIEIASIVELPDDIDEASGWLHHDPRDWSVVGRAPVSVVAGLSLATPPAAESRRPPPSPAARRRVPAARRRVRRHPPPSPRHPPPSPCHPSR